MELKTNKSIIILEHVNNSLSISNVEKKSIKTEETEITLTSDFIDGGVTFTG